jgi:malate dehydrogenase (oxaloacetate-decarboxylating)
MDEWHAFIRVAVAVGMKAQEQGVARIKATREELTARAESMIKGAREVAALLMREGLIPAAPED